ncbi:YibE/F family protein [Lactobacillus sp. DCY120]|uniref:YibE/F family protein n=1 Tax=Bombilactobacillus apium TaxID=2675299 RepID=A0A850R0V0_9LACO|nr:YibE/F family protein [Bombilactobacillus apium]NVY96543.1 YibE/F family protein [Bombilactobacillus apium]
MLILTLILLVLLILVCGRQGWIIFLSLAGSFLVLLVVMMLIADQFPALIVGVLAAIALVYLAIYPNTQNPATRKTAIWGTLIVLAGLLVLAEILINLAFGHGFALEDTDEIEQFVLAVGVSFPQIQVVVTLFSSLGAVAEASIAVSSGIWEIVDQQPQISPARLWRAGLAIGFKNISTAINTLLFGFFGSYLTLGLWFLQLHYSVAEIFNNTILATAVVELLLAVLGIIATIFLTNYLVRWQRR